MNNPGMAEVESLNVVGIYVHAELEYHDINGILISKYSHIENLTFPTYKVSKMKQNI